MPSCYFSDLYFSFGLSINQVQNDTFEGSSSLNLLFIKESLKYNLKS